MNVSLLKKCRAALNAGGRVVVQEFPLNEDRTGPLQGALFAINMLVRTEGGRTYTPREMGGWLRGAGLERVNSMNLEDNPLIRGSLRETVVLGAYARSSPGMFTPCTLKCVSCIY
jgi:hypothetical protein